MRAKKARIAILISGAGTNMAALLYHSRLPDCPYEIVLVASNNLDAEGLKLAAREGIATFAHPHKGMTRESHDAMIHEAIVAAAADYVALAGYMRILSSGFVRQWEGRMLNLHPSLLPAYKGLNTHQRALDAGDRHAGCSVHLVTTALDDGPVLGQSKVAIFPDDTADSLAARVRFAEHQLYPHVLSDYVSRATSPDYLVQQVRERAFALPEVEETLSHGMPCFGIIKGKKIAYVSMNHHGDGKIALLVKISGVEEQAMLIDMDPDRYYRPAYFGDGWVAIRLDLGDTDWDSIADWLSKSWRAVAPRKLAAMMDLMGEF
jgi:phosphoribosylglycinamide formyltransferase-1